MYGTHLNYVIHPILVSFLCKYFSLWINLIAISSSARRIFDVWATCSYLNYLQDFCVGKIGKNICHHGVIFELWNFEFALQAKIVWIQWYKNVILLPNYGQVLFMFIIMSKFVCSELWWRPRLLISHNTWSQHNQLLKVDLPAIMLCAM